MHKRIRAVVTLVLAGTMAACAARTASMPSVPTAPRYPDFVYPTVPDETASPALTAGIERGWRYLQAGDLTNAARAFDDAAEDAPTVPAPAETGLAYVDIAREAHDEAIRRFDTALQANASYVPALVGKGQALLAAGRDGDALASFERALSIADVPGLAARVEVLRFRAVQDNLQRAQAATAAGQWDEARAAYAQAVAASPESAFLYRDMADVERRAGRLPEALAHVRQALTLDASDAGTHRVHAEILDAQGDAAGARAALEKARALDPSAVDPELAARIGRAADMARLPAEYREIEGHATITRGELAALIGVRLQAALAARPARQVVITDIRGHWARDWILAVARAGVMQELPNYTFRPDARVSRADIAEVVSRALDIAAARRPDLMTKWRAASRPIPDVPPGHLAFAAVSLSVASGVLSLEPDGRFDLLRPVTGAEAVAVVDRLETLLAP